MSSTNGDDSVTKGADLDIGLHVKIGGLQVRASAANVNSSLGNRSTASLTFEPAHLSDPFDMSGTVDVTVDVDQTDGSPTFEHHLFSGHVTTARTDEDGCLSLDAETGVELAETVVGFLRTHQVHASEHFYLIGRLAGLPPDKIQARGLDSLPSEDFAVEVPLQGVCVERPIEVMGVELLPLDHPREGELMWGPFTPFVKDIQSRWGRPTARARTRAQGQLMYEAERDGLRRVEQALDATLATAVYGLSVDPWNRALPFDRRRLRTRPSAMPVVHSLGLSSGRQWIHGLPGPAAGTKVPLGLGFDRWAELLQAPPSEATARGMRSLRDAADESRDVFDRCHALCSVLEYYSADVSLPEAVSRASRRRALEALRSVGLSEDELSALTNAVNQVNSVPLLAKVRAQADRDRVPVNSAEWDLLSRLRRARNASVHGRVAGDAPSADDLRWGVSIGSRLLLHRWIADAR